MSADSPALFDDDTAHDVKQEFTELLAASHDAVLATAELIARWSDFLATGDGTPVFWLALAAVQRRYGCLQDEVRDRAVAVIDDGSDLRRWSVLPQHKERAAVLRRLRMQFVGVQPKPSIPGTRRAQIPPRRSVVSPAGGRTAEVVQLGGTRGYPMSTCVLIGDGQRGTSVLQVACSIEEVAVQWLGEAALETSYPRDATVERIQTEADDASGTLRVSFLRVG